MTATQAAHRPLTFYIRTGTNWGEMAALAMVTLILSAFIVIFAQRYIVMGLTFGAVKE